MAVAEHWLDPAGERVVDQDRVEMHRRLGHDDRMASRRGAAAVQPGQGLAIVECRGPPASGRTRRSSARSVSAAKPASSLPPVAAGLQLGGLHQHPLRPPRRIGRRQPDERQMAGALEMSAAAARTLLPVPIRRMAPPPPRRRRAAPRRRATTQDREEGPRIVLGLEALGLEEERPAGAEAAQYVVKPGTGRDQFRLGCAFEIRSPEADGALEAAVLVEDDARGDERCPRQVVGEGCRPGGGTRRGSALKPAPLAQMAGQHLGEISDRAAAAKTASEWPSAHRTSPAIQSCRPSPSAAATVPLTIAMPRGAPARRMGSVKDRCSGTSKPSICSRHATSAPPENEKNERKKLEAAKAIEMPNTI